MRQRYSADDADAGAGTPFLNNNNSNNHNNTHHNTNHHPQHFGHHFLSPAVSVESAPSSANTIHSAGNTDLELFMDTDRLTVVAGGDHHHHHHPPHPPPPVLVLGLDITHWSDRNRFLYCASGVFFFSLAYGYLQELLSVRLCSRRLGLFLALVQFTGYTLLAYGMRTYVGRQEQHHQSQQHLQQQQQQQLLGRPPHHRGRSSSSSSVRAVPLAMYLGLSLLRAIDLAMYVFIYICLLMI
jgi:hypothetical protein